MGSLLFMVFAPVPYGQLLQFVCANLLIVCVFSKVPALGVELVHKNSAFIYGGGKKVSAVVMQKKLKSMNPKSW